MLTAVPLLAVIFILLLFYPGFDQLFGEKKEEKVTVLVLRRDVNADDPLNETDVVQKVQNKSEVPAGTLNIRSIPKRRFKVGLPRNTILTENMVYEGEAVTKDERIHFFDYIECSETLKTGDYVDVRIVFPNGTDFILLSKKKVETIQPVTEGEYGTLGNELWFRVNEDEILRLSSALVDTYRTEGCRIYAIRYLLDSQDRAIVNYPVNPDVGQLMDMDPNIIKRAREEISERLRLLTKGEDHRMQRDGSIEE